MRTVLNVMATMAAMTAGVAHGEEIGIGKGQHPVTIDDTTLQTFTYRPAGCEPRRVLLVFHGSERDAGPYRDIAIPLADKLCAVVVSPAFDRRRFADSQYQLGGVVRDRTYVPAGHRPVDLVAPLVAWSRTAAGGTNLPVTLFAHSAGAQFIGRTAAFASTGGARIVLINPSTWVLPSADVAVPYGFDGVGSAPQIEHALRTYLALPITVLLGTADTGTFNLAMDPSAMAQGANRLQRGRNTFAMAEKVARERGWTFGWRKIEAEGAGHREMEMFNTGAAVEAVQ